MADRNTPVTGYPAPTPPAPATAAGHTTNGYPPPQGGYSTTNTATAYPYVGQSRPQPAHFNVSGYNTSNNYYDPYNNQQRATAVRRLFSIIVGSVILTGTIIFIIWLILRPQIPQFRIDALTLSNFNLSSNSMVSGNWDARFTVRNPNKKITLYYDHIDSGIFYKDDSISETTVEPFFQGTKTETAVRATFASLSTYMEHWSGINSEKASGTVHFNVGMVARVRFRAGGWWARRRILKVYCPSLAIGVSGNSTGGSLTGGSKQCRVGL